MSGGNYYTSQITPSYVFDNQHKLKKYNKVTFYRILKKSLVVSVFVALFIGILDNDFFKGIISLIISFFGTFVVLSAFFFIPDLFFMILDKIKRKKQIRIPDNQTADL